MSSNNDFERVYSLPSPIERIRQMGEAVVGMFTADPSYAEQLRAEGQAEKIYEDRIVSNLGDRILQLDSQEEIESAKSRHPSSRGYL